ncbi:MAG: arginine deiminase [Candidatus Muiribacterium halophilum]|uniref:Arginine deiminase n=1 Tax=Muiribacterium halophilum TaxID=2053465 RepID=A0A2N5ZA99_MUIH1|nr:MAG: arginine deiminase [Candidatus Muirbacterium halophilum]
MKKRIETNVRSEIGKLNAVILHTPGKEVENMTPSNTERALYSDVLNLKVASKEHSEFKEVLDKVAKTYEVRELLEDILTNEKVKEELVRDIVKNEDIPEILETLLRMEPAELSRQLIEGVVMEKNTLTKYLSQERYSLRPLHNFFFTRDASIAINDKILIGKMAGRVREREALIMEAIFKYHSDFSTRVVNPVKDRPADNKIQIEGGDILIAREDILLIGTGARTTSQGIDYIIDQLRNKNEKRHIIVQELPFSPESFIHLDMVFTIIDNDKCVVYEPLITTPNRFDTVHITIDNGKVKNIQKKDHITDVLKELGMDLKPIPCGGSKDQWFQEREQWHSGANFFAVGPGKIIGYGRNTRTLEALNKNGLEVIKAKDIIKGKKDLKDYEKYIVAIEGSELARGGGGARCMTMPISRETVK